MSDNSPRPKLKPCPWCGRKPYLVLAGEPQMSCAAPDESLSAQAVSDFRLESEKEMSRELDAKVAEAVGWENVYQVKRNKHGEVLRWAPYYSTDIAAAWGLVVEMAKHTLVTVGWVKTFWRCTWLDSSHKGLQQSGDTAPEAISLAYLKFKEPQGGDAE